MALNRSKFYAKIEKFGEMAEWFKAPVLKTGVGQLTVGSNPSLSADLERLISEIAVPFCYTAMINI